MSRSAFRRRIRRYAEDLRTDQGYAFLIFRSSDNALVGGLTLANIRRGVAQAGSLGYWMGQPFVRHGYMTAAVRAVIPFAFDTLRLHRLEAACIPTNAGSIRLLENTGFMREGYAREYLCINGIWQDHLLYGRLKIRRRADDTKVAFLGKKAKALATESLNQPACRLGMATVRLI